MVAPIIIWGNWSHPYMRQLVIPIYMGQLVIPMYMADISSLQMTSYTSHCVIPLENKVTFKIIIIACIL